MGDGPLKQSWRPTQQSAIARAFGGRSGFVSEQLGPPGDPSPAEPKSRGERTAAMLTWLESSNHFDDHVDESRARPRTGTLAWELLVSAVILCLFFGPYLAFIYWLAVTR